LNAEQFEQRLARLEAALAHAEKQGDELNAVVIEQGRLLGRMQKRLEQLGETLESQELDRARNTQQKPPHWMP
jgi:uncharacterized coiled-coil protein SlyX